MSTSISALKTNRQKMSDLDTLNGKLHLLLTENNLVKVATVYHVNFRSKTGWEHEAVTQNL